jgi:hypothetical protein
MGMRTRAIAASSATMGGRPRASTTGAKSTNASVIIAPGTRKSTSSLPVESRGGAGGGGPAG